MRPSRTLLLAPATLLSIGMAGCGSGDTIAPAAEDIRDYITAVATSGGIEAAFHSSFPPAASGGPTLIVDGTSAMITGGSAIRGVSSATAFTRIIVAINTVVGYWEITLPAPVTVEEIVLTIAQIIPEDEITLRYGLGGIDGVGAYEDEFVPVVIVGTGPLQVSVTWDVNSDVDLYLLEPGTTGEEIYYGNFSSAAGAVLDLDSNAGCQIDGKRAENITYGSTPPSGSYTVRVNLWAECSTTTSNYVVTVRRQGQPTLTFSGALTVPATPGGFGAGTVVTMFTW